MTRVCGEFYHARGVAAEVRNQPAPAPQVTDGIAWLCGGE